MKQKSYIILIDAPNGAGKDYLISGLSSKIEERYPTTFVDILTIKSLLKDELKNKVVERKTYDFNQNLFKELMDKHIEFLRYIDKSLNEIPSEDFTSKVVLINRYIPSFYVYQMCMNDTPPTLEEWNDFNTRYQQILTDIANRHKVIQIFILPDEDTLIERLDKDNRLLPRETVCKQLENYRDYICKHIHPNLSPVFTFEADIDFEQILVSINPEVSS
jgi:thymidylate kinase